MSAFIYGSLRSMGILLFMQVVTELSGIASQIRFLFRLSDLSYTATSYTYDKITAIINQFWASLFLF
jgi:hypothetical protein